MAPGPDPAQGPSPSLAMPCIPFLTDPNPLLNGASSWFLWNYSDLNGSQGCGLIVRPEGRALCRAKPTWSAAGPPHAHPQTFRASARPPSLAHRAPEAGGQCC